jgi:hypothetical protein
MGEGGTKIIFQAFPGRKKNTTGWKSGISNAYAASIFVAA